MGENVSPKKREMNWPTVLWYIHLHGLGSFGFYLLIFEAKWATVIFAALVTLVAAFGVTAGAHRLWAHGAYTASASLRLFLMLAHTLAGVGTVRNWVISHRIHHKFYGTERDPYNHKKGFIYSHILANLMEPDADYEKALKDIDLYDIECDGYLYIQDKFYWILMPIVGLLLPINAPAEYWGESIFNALFILGFFRLMITANITWLINSAAIIWGLGPGEKYPPDGNAIFLVSRSYWPNYHYFVPWDSKSGEFGTYDRGCTTTIIKILEILGLASGLKSTTGEEIRDALSKVATTGIKIEDAIKEVHKLAVKKTEMQKLAFKH